MKKYFLILTLITLYVKLYCGIGVEPSGSGTSGDPYQVATLDNLLWISTYSSSWASYFEQTGNIDASATSSWNGGKGWSPIGNTSDVAFTGSYNGQEHTISGLYISNTDMYMGFFGFTQNAAISNLGIIDVSISAGPTVGGLIGSADNTTINNCHTTGNLSGNEAIGGLVGANSNSSAIVNCYSAVSISGTANYAGGLVGSNGGNASISRSYSTGNTSGGSYCGGLVGRSTYTTIDNCYSTGDATGTNTQIGGLIGSCPEHTTVSNCYSTGTASGASSVGGLLGYNGGVAVSIDNSFWDTESSGNSSSSGGTGKTTAQMKTLATFTDTDTEGLTTAWDFETNPNDDVANNDYWDMDYSGTINSGYPYLNWQDGEDVSLPVELISFSAESVTGGVLLRWTTESEIENLGFLVERRAWSTQPGVWNRIADYRSEKALVGQGSTTQRHDYRYIDEKVILGMTYEYRLSDINYSGDVDIHDIIEITFLDKKPALLSKPFTLNNSYPNPFNSMMTISYQIQKTSVVNLAVYSIDGRLIETLVNDTKDAGYYTINWNANSVVSGIYLYRINVGEFSAVKKCLVVK